MSPHPKTQLRILTRFLAVAGLVSMLALLFGPAKTEEPAALAPVPDAPQATSTTVDAPQPVATPATTTTSMVEEPATPLEVFTPADIRAAIAPTVAFITTFNGTGSGVLVDDDILVTNAHVVWPFTTVGVLFPGDSRRAGRVVGIDPQADVAFLQVDSPRLPSPVRFGATDELEDGDSLFVVGYPAAIDFAPDPSIDVGPFRAVRKWEFSGASWVHSGSAAVGGQSGGALVDTYGRLVGVTTFGSPTDIYSLSVEDVRSRLDALDANELGGIDERLPPRRGGRRSLDLEFEGPWEQAAFVTWLSPGARSQLTSDAAIDWRALDPFGTELDSGQGSLDVLWALATPGVVLGEASRATSTVVEVSRPMVALDDPDDARSLLPGHGLSGFVDVPGDRDWFYLEVTGDDVTARIEVEAQTRVRIALYDRSSGDVIADVVHERGFFFDDPALEVEGLAEGLYVVTVEDVGAQFGTYRISVS